MVSLPYLKRSCASFVRSCEDAVGWLDLASVGKHNAETTCVF